MPFFSGNEPVSSTPLTVISSGFNRFERNRRYARTLSPDGALTPQNAFRGSTVGAQQGPYLSQFMLIGTSSIAGGGGGAASYPRRAAKFDLLDGYIPYGSLIIDQRAIGHKCRLDHMTEWSSWLDVQNGAKLGGRDKFEQKKRFITTPRPDPGGPRSQRQPGGTTGLVVAPRGRRRCRSRPLAGLAGRFQSLEPLSCRRRHSNITTAAATVALSDSTG